VQDSARTISMHSRAKAVAFLEEQHAARNQVFLMNCVEGAHSSWHAAAKVGQPCMAVHLAVYPPPTCSVPRTAEADGLSWMPFSIILQSTMNIDTLKENTRDHVPRYIYCSDR
jgi:hypothetical protein